MGSCKALYGTSTVSLCNKTVVLLPSCGKVMFLHVSVILFTGGCLPQCILGKTPPPRANTPLGADFPKHQTPPLRVVVFEGWGCLPQCMLGYSPRKTHTPPGKTSPWETSDWEQCMLGDMANKRAVRIQLECILVPILLLDLARLDNLD